VRLSLSVLFFAFVFSFCAVWEKTSGNDREHRSKHIERENSTEMMPSEVRECCYFQFQAKQRNILNLKLKIKNN